MANEGLRVSHAERHAYPVRHYRDKETGEVQCGLPLGGIEYLQTEFPANNPRYEWVGEIIDAGAGA